MVRIAIEIRSNRLGAIAAKLPGEAGALVTKTTFDVEAQAKANIVSMRAVDTSAMLNSTQGRMVGPASGEVRVGKEYGVHVHEGTHKMAGRPFLQLAAEQVRPDFEAAAAKLAGDL